MRARNWVLLLLVIPFAAVLWPPLYAGANPVLAGIPYFIWYQFAWAIISAAITIFVYFVQRSDEPATEAAGAGRAAPPIDAAGEGDAPDGGAL